MVTKMIHARVDDDLKTEVWPLYCYFKTNFFITDPWCYSSSTPDGSFIEGYQPKFCKVFEIVTNIFYISSEQSCQFMNGFRLALFDRV